MVPTIRLGPPSPRIVKLLDERGCSLPGVTVRVVGELSAYLAVTGRDGRCELGAASGLGETVHVTHPDYADVKFWVGAEDEVPSEIRLERTGAISHDTR